MTAVKRPGRTSDAAGSAADDRVTADGTAESKTRVLTHHSASIVPSIADAIVIKEGEPFFLCPPDGQIDVSGAHGLGLYHHDMRFLSGYQLTIAGATPNPLAATAVTGGRALLELTMPEIVLGDGRTIGKEHVAIRWTRQLDGDSPCLVDRISCRSFDRDDARLPVRLSFAAGFEDVFVVRGLLPTRRGTLEPPEWRGDTLTFRYDGADGVVRSLKVTVSPAPTSTDDATCTLSIAVPARGEATIEVRLEVDEQLQPGAPPIERRSRGGSAARRDAEQRDSRTEQTARSGGDDWPVAVTTDSMALNAALSRSFDDLLTLRGELDGLRYYAAGVPWFATLFGRDSLIAAYQSLAFDPRIAEETLRLLARRQGEHVDEYRDEQPGKILHELRIGELARLHAIPHTPYYGSIDATLLFLIVLARHASWTGSLDLFHELRSNVQRALDWLDEFGDPTGNGFVAYESTTGHGLVNQGWKDSGDAIVTADGSIATPPIALAEVQGYAYAARREIAMLFERDGDEETAGRLRAEADSLRQRFEVAFWSDELGCYALALESEGKRCAVASSNAGQVLWSGIADDDRARKTARRLVADDLFAGWGIRTLSSDATAYNPIGYHLGTVWPHDNGLIVEGFRRYRCDDESEKVFTSLVEASMDFPQQRLPECFAGYARSDFGVPVRYPIACHPQAWAAGAIPHLLTTTLGLAPDAFAGRLRIARPRLPEFLELVEVHGLGIGRARVDLRFERSGTRTTTSVGEVDGELDVRIEDDDGSDGD